MERNGPGVSARTGERARRRNRRRHGRWSDEIRIAHRPGPRSALTGEPRCRQALREIVRVACRRFAIDLLHRNGLLRLWKGRGAGRGGYRGARWHSIDDARALFRDLPVRHLRVQTAIHIPTGGFSNEPSSAFSPPLSRPVRSFSFPETPQSRTTIDMKETRRLLSLSLRPSRAILLVLGSWRGHDRAGASRREERRGGEEAPSRMRREGEPRRPTTQPRRAAQANEDRDDPATDRPRSGLKTRRRIRR